jgi:hypothetical protein
MVMKQVRNAEDPSWCVDKIAFTVLDVSNAHTIVRRTDVVSDFTRYHTLPGFDHGVPNISGCRHPIAIKPKQ